MDGAKAHTHIARKNTAFANFNFKGGNLTRNYLITRISILSPFV